MLAARRALAVAGARMAPRATAVAVATVRRRNSAWPPKPLAVGRWLATTAGGPWVGDTSPSRNTEAAQDAGKNGGVPQKKKTRMTAAQKEARVFELLPELLRAFEASQGHRVVPYRFVVPATWPREAHGINLRRKLRAFASNVKHQEKHPRVVEALRAMGFPLGGDSFDEYMWEHETMAALRAFRSIHGHCLVPQDFEVPTEDVAWPVAVWKYKLGRRVSNIRHHRDRFAGAELKDLASLDFSFDVSETAWNEQVLPALETFTSVHGHCRVPKGFEVPFDDSWPQKAWGYALGVWVADIRANKCYTKQVQRDQDRLDSIGFVRDYYEHMWSDIILPSLESFYALKGHSRVPTSFVVPSESPWPEEAWGHKLGRSVDSIRSKGAFPVQSKRDAARLEAIDFARDVYDHRWGTAILPALKTFSKVYRHCDVPRAFVVPSESPWPIKAWGMRLGNVVVTMRSRFSYDEQAKRDRDELEAIGFVWNHREFQWTRRILPSLETFYQEHGHVRVPYTFVVPSTSPWPAKASGLRLGAAAVSVRRYGAYADLVERDMDRLVAIGFKVDSLRGRTASEQKSAENVGDEDGT